MGLHLIDAHRLECAVAHMQRDRSALDAPRISAILVESPFPGAPLGVKGVGELPMDVGAPAVIAAIADATGAWIGDLPASPERVLAALAGDPAIAGLRPGQSEPRPAERAS